MIDNICMYIFTYICMLYTYVLIFIPLILNYQYILKYEAKLRLPGGLNFSLWELTVPLIT